MEPGRGMGHGVWLMCYIDAYTGLGIRYQSVSEERDRG